MPSTNFLQLMGIPISPPEQVITTVQTDDEGEKDEDTISILPSQSYDNIVIDLSKVSLHEIESRLHGGSFVGTSTIDAKTDAANPNYSNNGDDDFDNISNQLILDERDLNLLLEILLRGKNDDIEEETMNQSMAIYRKLFISVHASCAVISGRSIEVMTEDTTARIVVDEDSLVYAVRKKYSDENMMELMNMLFDAMDGSKQNAVDGRRILGLALLYGNVGASRAIIQRYPDSLNTRDDFRGQLPLHVACDVAMMDDDEHYDEDGGFSVASTGTGRNSLIKRKGRKYRQAELIELLINEGIEQCVGCTYGAGGLYEQDNFGTTPLMQIIHALNNPFAWDDNDNNDDTDRREGIDAIFNNNTEGATLFSSSHETLKRPLDICIEAAWNSCGPSKHFPILHEAMNISSPDAFCRILEIVKYYDNDLSGIDRRGRTALVKAIYIDNNTNRRRTAKRDIIQMILNDTPQCATIRDGAGRLPIHIAAEMGLFWYDGLSDIVDAHYQGLEEPHSILGLHPFILAAQKGSRNDLYTLYRLVREQPKLITSGKASTRSQSNFFERDNRNLLPVPSVHRPLIHDSQ